MAVHLADLYDTTFDYLEEDDIVANDPIDDQGTVSGSPWRSMMTRYNTVIPWEAFSILRPIR